METLVLSGLRSCEAKLDRVLANQSTIIRQQEKIMSTTATGLAALQTFVTSFQNFETQLTTDIATLQSTSSALQTEIQSVIASLGASEDPQVQAAVAQLQSILGSAQTQDTTLESVNSNLASLSSTVSSASSTSTTTTATPAAASAQKAA
jgi:DNA repair exonuclease SbcCD ATPase subunit